MGRFGHQLVGPDDRDVRQSAEVGLEPPDALIARHHGVVVTAGVLVVDVAAVHGDFVAYLPVSYQRSRAQDDTRGVGTDDVIVQSVTLTPDRLRGKTVEKAKGGQGLEDARPEGIE